MGIVDAAMRCVGGTRHEAAEMGNSRCCCALAAKRLLSMWLCAGPYLVMSTAEAHLLTVSEDRDRQSRWEVAYDVSLSSIMEPGGDCGAWMGNDCQPCGHAQAHVRQSISLEYLHKDKGRRPQMGRRCSRFTGYPGDQIKAAGAGRGSSKCLAAINCGQSAPWTPQVPCREMRVSSRQGLRPASGEPFCPPARGRKEGKGNILKEVPGGCRWKWTVNKARWRTTEPEDVKFIAVLPLAVI
jgi:hypothetical protein